MPKAFAKGTPKCPHPVGNAKHLVVFYNYWHVSLKKSGIVRVRDDEST